MERLSIWVSLVDVGHVDLGHVSPSLSILSVDLWRRHSLVRVVAESLPEVERGELVVELPRTEHGLRVFCESLRSRLAPGWRMRVVQWSSREGGASVAAGGVRPAELQHRVALTFRRSGG